MNTFIYWLQLFSLWTSPLLLIVVSCWIFFETKQYYYKRKALGMVTDNQRIAIALIHLFALSVMITGIYLLTIITVEKPTSIETRPYYMESDRIQETR